MKTARIQDIDLAYIDQGRGPIALLVHGFPLNHTMWLAQIDELAKDHRVIAPDLRGFGRSGVTEGTVTMEMFADDLAALLDALGVREPVRLCGLSMGGYIAFAFWRRHAARVRALLLMDTRAAGDTPEAAAGRKQMAERISAEGHKPILDAMLPKLLAPRAYTDRLDLVEQLRGMFIANTTAGIIAALHGLAQRADSRPTLVTINVPTLALVGSEDAITPAAEMRTMAEAIRGARYVEIRGAGHMAPMEDPVAVNAAIREFLADVECRQS